MSDLTRRAYLRGHRDGVQCGVESAGWGFIECEHIARRPLRSGSEVAAAPADAFGDGKNHAPVQYDSGCDEHGGTTERHCALDGHPMPAEVAAAPGLDVDALADEVRYAGGNGTSDYWRGFNDGIDRLAARLTAKPSEPDWDDERRKFREDTGL